MKLNEEERRIMVNLGKSGIRKGTVIFGAGRKNCINGLMGCRC